MTPVKEYSHRRILAISVELTSRLMTNQNQKPRQIPIGKYISHTHTKLISLIQKEIRGGAEKMREREILRTIERKIKDDGPQEIADL